MFVIDTNIFLEVIFDQGNVDSCLDFLNKTSKGDFNCFVADFSVHAVEAQIGDDPDLIEDFLRDLEKSIGLEIRTTDISEHRGAALEMGRRDLTFDDQLLLEIARKEDISTVVSLDSDFDSTDLERKEPSEIIS